MQIGIGYWLISSRWTIFLTKGDMKNLSYEINAAKPLPENFMNVYAKMFPNEIHTTMTQHLFLNYGTRIAFRKRQLEDLPHCSCDFVYDIQVKSDPVLKAAQWPGRIQELEYGFAIEKFSSPEKCFDYVILDRIAYMRNIPVLPEYEYLKTKAITSMSDDELVKFILLIKASHEYLTINDPVRFEESVFYFQRKIEASLS